MEKKYFNWLGWSLSFFYILILIALIFWSVILNEKNVSNLLILVAGLWGFATIFLIKITMNKTWFHILPEKVKYAKVISKNNYQETIHSENGPTLRTQLITIFILEDGSRKAFPMKEQVYYTILLNETGILKYKEYKKKMFFISFDQQP